MEKFLKSINRLQKVVSNNGEVYIRCAGVQGQRVLDEVEMSGIKIKGFLDLKYNERKEIKGHPIFDPEIVYKLKKGTFYILVVVENDYIYRRIHDEYIKKGLKPVEDYCDFSGFPDERMYSFRDVKSAGDLKSISIKLAQERLEEMKRCSVTFRKILPDRENIIGNLDVVLTTRCTMRCENCSHGIPLIKNPKDFEAKKILEDIKIITKKAYIACLALMGGEPFLYREMDAFLDEYVMYANKTENIGFTRIVTNATILPKENTFKKISLLDSKQIYISNYGSRSGKIQEMVSACELYKIPYYICPEEERWTTLGDYKWKREYTTEEISYLYNVCGARECRQLYDGKLFNCARLAALYDEGLIEEHYDDWLDIRNDLEKDSNIKMNNYLYEKKYLEGCRFCDGQHLYSKRVQRGY